MSKKTLNKANLEALGAAQLAALLIEISTGSADIKRRLRLEISHSLGTDELARDVRKRLFTIRKSTSYVGWRKRRALIKDLRTQAAMIADRIAPQEPTTAFDLLWDFIEMAPSVLGRVDDSRGEVTDVFRSAFAQLGEIAPFAQLDSVALAERVWTALEDNSQGEWDGVITLMAPALGAPGLARLKEKAQAFDTAPSANAQQDHAALQFLRQLRGGDSYVADQKTRFVRTCLQEIAVTTGDTQLYVGQYTDDDLKRRDIAAEVAQLFLADARAEDALSLLLDADDDANPAQQSAWDTALIASLSALGRVDEAQAHRWECFEQTLNAQHLRDHLKLLPDFEDVEAEDRARRHVLSFYDASAALEFCVEWPDLLTAARLVETRAPDLDGNRYPLLIPAAEALRARHPLAAVLLCRAMIDFTLDHGRSSRYGAAADHLADCAALDTEIADYGQHPDHADYIAALRVRHGRKFSFWESVI